MSLILPKFAPRKFLSQLIGFVMNSSLNEGTILGCKRTTRTMAMHLEWPSSGDFMHPT